MPSKNGVRNELRIIGGASARTGLPGSSVCRRAFDFGERIGAVLDPHRRFDVIESAGSDLVKNLRGVGHPILAKVDAARTPARHRAQAVVGVGDAQSGCEAREQVATLSNMRRDSGC